MQLGLSYVGFNYSMISKVSNNGGNCDPNGSTLNTRCNPRKGGVLRSKQLSPTNMVIV
jgi:hypothetical protein